MQQDRKCSACNAFVSSDLSNCPLCGKYIADGKDCHENNKSYPVYNFKHIDSIKWHTAIRISFWLIALICTIVNIAFKTEPYWFAYVLAALVLIFHVFIEPIKASLKNYLKNLTIVSVIVSLFVVFIDVYNHLNLKTSFGWSIEYCVPAILMASVLVETILCFCLKRYENNLLRSVTFIAVLSVIYFVVMLVLNKYSILLSLIFMLVSLTFTAILRIFKRNKLARELAKEFHI